MLQMVTEPESVKAATSVETLYVGDTAIVQAGAVVLEGVSEGVSLFGGTVTYDKNTQTLTLDGVDINQVSDQTSMIKGSAALFVKNGNLNIHIASPSKVTIPTGTTVAGIAGYMANITLTGEKLEITNLDTEDDVPFPGQDVYGAVYFGIGTISSGKVTI